MFNRITLVSLLSLPLLPSCKLVEGCPVEPLTFAVREPDAPCAGEPREVDVRTCEWAGYFDDDGSCQGIEALFIDLRTGDCLLKRSSCFNSDDELSDDPNIRPCEEDVGSGCCDFEPWVQFCSE
jgi:hypothetical protein